MQHAKVDEILTWWNGVQSAGRAPPFSLAGTAASGGELRPGARSDRRESTAVRLARPPRQIRLAIGPAQLLEHQLDQPCRSDCRGLQSQMTADNRGQSPGWRVRARRVRETSAA